MVYGQTSLNYFLVSPYNIWSHPYLSSRLIIDWSWNQIMRLASHLTRKTVARQTYYMQPQSVTSYYPLGDNPNCLKWNGDYKWLYQHDIDDLFKNNVNCTIDWIFGNEYRKLYTNILLTLVTRWEGWHMMVWNNTDKNNNIRLRVAIHNSAF